MKGDIFKMKVTFVIVMMTMSATGFTVVLQPMPIPS